jgi:hypothetical protein
MVGSIPELPKSFPILEAEGQMVDFMFLCCSLHVMAIASTMYVFESKKFVLLTERWASQRVLSGRYPDVLEEP